MDFSYMGVIAALGMIGLAFLTLVALSARNLFNGKHSIFGMVFFLVPAVVFGICYAMFGGDLDKTAVMSMIIMLILGLLAIVLSGFKSIFS